MRPLGYGRAMQLPFSLPDWAPPWLGFVILVVGALFLLAFLAMPFSVFGLKGRMEGLEARLDELHRELRSLALRLPEPARPEFARPLLDEETPAERRRWAEQPSRPPIPPRASVDDRPAPPATRRVAVRPGQTRSEPRFDPD